MNRWIANSIATGTLPGSAALLALLLTLGLLSLSAAAQTAPEIERLAARTSRLIAKDHAQRIVVSPGSSCLAAPAPCADFETSLRAQVRAIDPNVQFVERGVALAPLTKQGFLSVDAYQGGTEALAWETGADFVVYDRVNCKDARCEMTAGLLDAKELSGRGDFTSRIPHPRLEEDGDPFLLTDPKTKASIIIFAGDPLAVSSFEYPKCEDCPEPVYTDSARKKRIEGLVLLLLTVTDQGTATDIGVLRGLSDGLTEAAVDAVRGWRFKPAVAPGKKLFAARVPVEVRFHIDSNTMPSTSGRRR